MKIVEYSMIDSLTILIKNSLQIFCKNLFHYSIKLQNKFWIKKELYLLISYMEEMLIQDNIAKFKIYLNYYIKWSLSKMIIIQIHNMLEEIKNK